MEEVKNERKHGSATLARMVLDAYRALAEESRELERDIHALAEAVSRARPAMPLVNRFSREVVKRLRSYTRECLLEACGMVEEEYRGILASLVEKAAELLEGVKVVATISHSNTVVQALRKAASVERVVILESRPLLEGLLGAGELADAKHVAVCVDAAAGYAVEHAEAVLVGADALFPDGGFSSKVGVKSLALYSLEHGKPFYVASDTWKYTDRFENEYGPAEDITSNPRFMVLNPVFERVKPRYVSGYVTEVGVFGPADMRRVVG